MKKKIIILTLCFTIILSSINLKKSYAFDFVITPTVAVVLTSIAFASGIAFTSNDDLYTCVNMFYQKHKDNWESVSALFDVGVSIGANKLLTVSDELLSTVKDFLDTYFYNSDSYTPTSAGSLLGFPIYTIPSQTVVSSYLGDTVDFTGMFDSGFTDIAIGGLLFTYASRSWVSPNYYRKYNFPSGIKYNGSSCYFSLTESILKKYPVSFFISDYWLTSHGYYRLMSVTYDGEVYSANIREEFNEGFDSAVTMPYTGGYEWNDGIKDGIYVPGNLGDLVNSNPGTNTSTSTDLPFNPTDGIVSLPSVDNPSISIDGTSVDLGVETDTDVGVDTGTGSTTFDTIKEFIISLVVPSDAFWVDTFGGLRGSFETSFPMINLDNFKMLVVGGKPFPNIYINVFGSKCKIVDGDVINSIVDWLRPLIAGFMMLCLMLFNYRKIYKLIRNTEPFGNIAPGTSDFRTGMSAPSMSEGFSAYDIARDQLRDVAFDMRNEILARKNKV